MKTLHQTLIRAWIFSCMFAINFCSVHVATAQNTVPALYGLSTIGGKSNAGTVFRVNADGNDLAIVHSFAASGSISAVRAVGKVVVGSDKFLYGMSQNGGSYGRGTIYKIRSNHTGFRILHSFSNSGNGEAPTGYLLAGMDGNLYGVAHAPAEGRVVFKIDTAGNFTPLATYFSDPHPNGVASNSLLQLPDGNLIITNMRGGNGSGSILKLNPAGGPISTVFNFGGSNGNHPLGVILASDGKFYGVDYQGGAFSDGSIFSLNTDGTNYTVLYSFSYPVNDSPAGNLVEGPDGALYGMTAIGGPLMGGNIFKINRDGSGYINLHNFDERNPINGDNPTGDLIVHNNTLYGSTQLGGSYKQGTVFSYNLTTNTFSKLADLNTPVGVYPYTGGLTLVNVPVVSTPTVQSSNFSYQNINSGLTKVSVTPGNGSHRIAVVKKGSAPVFSPQNSVTYTAGEIENGEEIVYAGTASTFDLTNLEPETTYYIKIFELNADGGFTRYLVNGVTVNSITTAPLKNFRLIYFRTRKVVADFDNEITLDVADPDIENYTIEANMPSTSQSVWFALNGNTVNIDNNRPYTINYWVLPVLSAGVHRLRAEGYTEDYTFGDLLESNEADIHVINSAAITHFEVIGGNGSTLRTLDDGDTLNIADPELQNFTVIARSNIETIRSVKFTLNNITARIDNRAPYGVYGTSDGTDKPWPIKPGTYVLKATPFMKYNAWGPAGTSLTVNIKVISEAASARLAGNGVESITEKNQETLLSKWEVYPIPVKEELNISLTGLEGDVTMKIMNLNGQQVFAQKANVNHQTVYTIQRNQISGSQGLYILRVQDSKNRLLTKKVVLE